MSLRTDVLVLVVPAADCTFLIRLVVDQNVKITQSKAPWMLLHFARPSGSLKQASIAVTALTIDDSVPRSRQ